MILATIGWNDSSSAALVLGDRIAPVRRLPGRQDASDVLSLIRKPLTQEERKQLSAAAVVDPQVRWLPPILHPPKNLLCVGRNALMSTAAQNTTRGSSDTAEKARCQSGSSRRA